MHPKLKCLQPYPFEKLRLLFERVTPNSQLNPINLSVGEPKHPTPQFICDALSAGFDWLAIYPTTVGHNSLRQTISDWLKRRYHVSQIDPTTQVIPTLGSREALFSLAQTVLDGNKRDGLVPSNAESIESAQRIRMFIERGL
jgi:N-succinyldiaminopimelate aminotransferase